MAHQTHHQLCPDRKHPWKIPANCQYCQVIHKATLQERNRVNRNFEDIYSLEIGTIKTHLRQRISDRLRVELDGADGGYADGVYAALNIVANTP